MTHRVGKLAKRRGEVVALLMSGLSQAQVARRLDISSSSVSRDVARIRDVVNSGSCREALDEALEKVDRQRDGDSSWTAKRATLRGLANAVDDDPTSPSLWREYRQALEDWLTDDDDEGWREVVEAMQAEVGDAAEA